MSMRRPSFGQMSYPDQGTPHIQVLKLDDHRKKLTEEETAQLKQAIYAATGATFPLDIASMKLGEHGDIGGMIKSVDKEQQRELFENPDNMLGPNMPDAYWITFAPDAAIIDTDGTAGLTFADLRKGQRVEARSNGFIAQSYPGQATALELKLLPD
jgi:hypothetical protein